MLIIIGTIVGTALILMNVLLIGCCLHRRSKKRLAGKHLFILFFCLFVFSIEYGGEIQKMIPEDLLEKQDLPKVVIISVSVIGVILLLINIGLVAGCILKKRAKRVKGNFCSVMIYFFIFCTFARWYMYMECVWAVGKL